MSLKNLFLMTFVSFAVIPYGDQSDRFKRNFDTNARNWETKWKDRKVPYVFQSNFPQRLKADFQCAIKEYADRTCIRFVPRNGESTFLTVGYEPDQCGVAWGTDVRVGDKCGGDGKLCGVLIHELGHILGYAHEQNRPDRDNWIKGDGMGDPAWNFETFCLMYDYVSVEHYEDQCKIPGKHGSWEPTKPGVTHCGGGNKLSVLDVNKFNTAYKCGGCLAYRWMGIGCYKPQEHVLIQGGYDIDPNVKLYVCRGFVNGDIIPGKAVIRDSGQRYCYVGYKNVEYRLSDFEVLTNPRSNGANLQWVVTPDLPSGAIAGGRVSDRTTYYVGRCFIKSNDKWSLAIGKIYATNTREMKIAFGGREVGCDTEIGYLSCN